MKSIQEIAKNFNFYVKGDMAKFYKALINEGYHIISTKYNHANGWGTASTTIEYLDGNCEFKTETVNWG